MSESLSNLVLTSEVQCRHCADPYLECVPDRVHNFFTEFIQKMENVVIDSMMNNSSIRLGSDPLQIDPPSAWKEIMTRMSRRIDYQDRDACKFLMNCFVSLGTNLLLDDGNINPIYAGLLAMTLLRVEYGVGRFATAPASRGSNGLDFNSKIRDLWDNCEREMISFFHKRNGCTCLKESMTD